MKNILSENIIIDKELEELIPIYLSRRRDELVLIRHCIDADDFESLSKIAHRLKGSGGGYGFSDLTCLGQKMEMLSKEKNKIALTELSIQLERYLDNLKITYR